MKAADLQRQYAAENAAIAARLRGIGAIQVASGYAAADAHRQCADALDQAAAGQPAKKRRQPHVARRQRALAGYSVFGGSKGPARQGAPAPAR